jgi:four helix bundle protein
MRLRDRTKGFALAVMRLVESLPRTRSADVIGLQLLRSATSVAANYRSASRARSRKEFIAKMGIVEEEADESQLWLDLTVEGGVVDAARVDGLRKDIDVIVAMTVSSIRTARGAHPSAPHTAPRTPHSSSGEPDVC